MQSGLPIGRMQPAQPQREAPPQAACDECGARLSRWRAQHGGQFETTCAPCQFAKGQWHDDTPPDPAGESSAERARKAATKPIPLEEQKRGYRNLSTEDRILTGKYSVCPDCKKELKLKRAKRCTKCAAAARRTAGPGSRFCACGNTKGTSNEKCMECRYPNSARAQLRRLNRAA